jgi:poly-gamma-glutamate capsule biosynthesis protein CapA/YwtB (metallophosphatase superfamily)
MQDISVTALARAFPIALLTFLAAACGDEGSDPGEAAETQDCAAPCDLYEIVWAGDILLGDAAQPFLDEFGYEWPFEEVEGLLEGDYVIGNAEGPITELTEHYNPDQEFHYNADPQSAEALAGAGFDALGVANNHTLDRGPEGAIDTIEHLEEVGIEAFGAGRDGDEAEAPLLIETPHGLLAVFAFTEDVHGYAGRDEPGPAILDDESIERAVGRAEAEGADWLVAYVHWGENYADLSRFQLAFAPALARAGFDLVVGHHAHVPQTVTTVEGAPVIYSLGNFVFGTPGRFTEEFPGYGLVARTFLGRKGFERLELTCILTDNEEVVFQPQPCPEEEAQEVMEGLGDEVVWLDGVGVVELP